MGMKKEEFGLLVKGMKAVYADPKFIADKDAFEIWYAMFSDMSYNVANAAVQSYMTSQRFAPTPADIRNKAFDLTEPEEMNAMEAWSLVRKAAGNAYYHGKEEFEKLPPILQKSVGSVENLRHMADLDMDDVGISEQSKFIRSYDATVARKREIAKIPQNVRNLIGETERKMIHD